MALKTASFTYIPPETFNKNFERIQKFRETGNLKHFYRTE